MTGFIDDLRKRKRERRELLRKVLFGDTARPKPLERVLVVLSVALGGFICYRFRLVHAHTFGILGFVAMITYFVLRRICLSRKPAPRTGGAS